MNAQDFARLRIGSYRYRHDCRQKSRGKPLQVRVTSKGVWWKCFRCGESGGTAGDRPQVVGNCDNQRHLTLSQYGRDLFAARKPLAGAAREYLESRRCVIPPADGDLRYDPKLRHPGGYEGPALVALGTDAVTRERRTLHRTWIRPDGRKADIAPPRLFLKGHTTAGAVLRLWPDEDGTRSVGIAEGVETALCAAHGFTPMWCAFGAGNLARPPQSSPGSNRW